LCSPNFKGQIKDIKLGDDPRVMVFPKMFEIKEKKFSHVRGLSLKSKGISLLERFVRLIAIIGPNRNALLKRTLGLR